jgi:hypothetical protein
MTRLLGQRLVNWLQPVHLSTKAQFEADPMLEHRQRLARESLVKKRKNVDAEKRIKLWIVK